MDETEQRRSGLDAERMPVHVERRRRADVSGHHFGNHERALVSAGPKGGSETAASIEKAAALALMALQPFRTKRG
jgi:hypothetical protein